MGRAFEDREAESNVLQPGTRVGTQEFDEVQSEGNPACGAGDAEG